MQVNVKLFATLRNNREKERLMTLEEGVTVRDVIGFLGIPEQEAAIIFINGRGVKLDHSLSDEETLSIFPPIGGG